MAYIGAEPLPGQNREVDDISSSFNGSTTAFTLQVNGLNVSPETANNILVNIGGVIQNPGTDYTIAASTITFTTAPAAGLSFFAIILGAGINTATVADDTIGPSKLIDTAVTAGSYTTADITVDAQGRITAAASGTISGAEIADNAVTTAKIADSTGSSDGVTTAKLATDAVTAAKLASNAVVNASVDASAAIAGTKISPDFGSQNIVTTGSISGAAGTLTGDLTIPDTIVHTGDTNTKIRFPAADNISFEVGGNERLRIDNADKVIARDTTAAILRIENSTAAASQTSTLDFAPANSLSGVQMVCTSDEDFSTGANRTASFKIKVRKDGTFSDSIFIDSSGRLGINESSPDRKLHITDSSFAAIRLENSSTSISDGTNISALEFSHADSSAPGVGAGILAAMSNTSTGALDLIFKTGTGVSTYQENMRLTGAGFLGIGMTPAVPLHVTGSTADTLRITNGSNTSIYYKIGRNHLDGKLEFRGTQSGDECYSFGGVSGEKIRFQPAGGISFNGDTAAANALDDYEEGTWTPAISGVTYNDAQGTYIKIGRSCFVTLTLNAANTSVGNTDVRITGLPFTPKVAGGEYYPANSVPLFEVSSVSLASGYNNMYLRIDDAQGNLQILVTDGESHGILTAGGGTTLNSNHVLRTSFTYETNA